MDRKESAANNLMDEAKIQLALYRELLSRGHEIITPNVSWSWLNWEADIISFTRAHYMYEFEIKISKADFLNDFTKRKHGRMKIASTIPMHHNFRMPNYFSYVAPESAMPLCIPDHAGLIEVYVSERYKKISLIEIKKPPLLHKNKPDTKAIFSILRTMMFKYWNLAENLNVIKIQKELFKER